MSMMLPLTARVVVLLSGLDADWPLGVQLALSHSLFHSHVRSDTPDWHFMAFSHQ